MRWIPGGRSTNLEDRRGARLGRPAMGAGATIILLILSLVFGKDFFSLLGSGAVESPGATSDAPVQASPEEDRQVQFVSFVLDTVQATWQRTLPQQGADYQAAKLVLFRGAVQSACGFAESATGPFYCPGDQKVYVDLDFYQELRSRFGAPGDFAQAYVLAHEIGHHVQHLLGIDTRARNGRGMTNQMSVRLELQADCFAGIWAHSADAERIMEPGDLEEGINAAAAVGDDRLQKMATGRVMPESFTHGSSQQRATWFRRGHDSGRLADCDTFR